jgi:hypothetical protein
MRNNVEPNQSNSFLLSRLTILPFFHYPPKWEWKENKKFGTNNDELLKILWEQKKTFPLGHYIQGHFRQGFKEYGPMKLRIPIGEEFLIGPKVFSWGSMTKTNQIVIKFTWHHFERKIKGKLMFWRIKVQAKVSGCSFLFLGIFFQCFLLPLLLNFCDNRKYVVDRGHCSKYINSPIFDEF